MKIVIRNQISEISRVNEIFQESSKPWNLSLRMEAQMDLILDELLSNIIKYAYTDDDPHEIEINIECKDNKIFLNIVDDGIEFNPLDYPEPDLNPNLSERQIGGLGIHIIKNLTHRFIYNRVNGYNIQKIIKHID
jgi:anti-sigma regulatory factor (Ser/Thr protein kinase)